MKLRDDQIERYSRQILLPNVGGKGQEKLLNARVLIIGAGGLGSPCTLYLTSAGIGTLGIVDSDKVELNNLQRQIVHEEKSVENSQMFCGEYPFQGRSLRNHDGRQQVALRHGRHEQGAEVQYSEIMEGGEGEQQDDP